MFSTLTEIASVRVDYMMRASVFPDFNESFTKWEAGGNLILYANGMAVESDGHWFHQRNPFCYTYAYQILHVFVSICSLIQGWGGVSAVVHINVACKFQTASRARIKLQSCREIDGGRNRELINATGRGLATM